MFLLLYFSACIYHCPLLTVQDFKPMDRREILTGQKEERREIQ